MKHLRYIVSIALCAWSLGAWAQDYTRLSERTILGTARYIGMSGAMTAIGGDPSAALDNPAGLGLYRRSELLLTGGVSLNGSPRVLMNRNGHYFMFPQASVVFSIPARTYGLSGVQFHNLMFSYHRLHSFNRVYGAEAQNTTSLGHLLTEADVTWDIPFCSERTNAYSRLILDESGHVDQFAFHWAMNISDRWYVGLGLQMQSYLLSQDAEYYESFATLNEQRVPYSNTNISTVILSGVGFNMSLGLLYRPTRWLRLGAGLQVPTVGKLNTYTSGTLKAQTDSLRLSSAPDMNSLDRAFHMPWRLSTSVAFQIGAYALLALQYDYAHASYMADRHTLRAGFEVVPVLGLYINAGYAFESDMRSWATPTPMDKTFDRQDTYSLVPHIAHYGSCAIGYRGAHMLVQVAYQYHWKKPFFFGHEYMKAYDNVTAETHRIVLTLGWHRNW